VKLGRKEHKLRVLEKGMLRRIFGPKRDEVVGGWIKLHIIDLYIFCSLASQR
jgi:hypothetical protein